MTDMAKQISFIADSRVGQAAMRGPLGTAPPLEGIEAEGVAVRVVVASRLEQLAHLWPRFRPSAGPAYFTVFQSADLLALWLAAIGRRRDVEPCFVAVTDAVGRPLMLLPLGLTTRRGLRVLSFLDAGACDYNAPVLFEATPDWSADELHAVWAAITRALPPFDVLRLEKMLVDVCGRRNPLLHLGSSAWECSGHAVSIRARAQSRGLPNARASRRKLRRLNEIAPCRFVFAREPDEIVEVFEALMRHKQRRFAETRVPGFEQHPGLVDLYRDAPSDADLAPNVLLAALYCGDEPIAEQWGLLSGDALILLVCGNAGGRWSACSPGRLLNEHLIAWAEGEGLASVDFGIGDEPYKAEYCDTRICLAGVVKAQTLKGRVGLGLSRLVERARATRAYQWMRPLKWTAKRWLQARIGQ